MRWWRVGKRLDSYLPGSPSSPMPFNRTQLISRALWLNSPPQPTRQPLGSILNQLVIRNGQIYNNKLHFVALHTFRRSFEGTLSMSMAAVKPAMKASVITPVAPMSRSTPVTASPHPAVIAPSPASTHPDITYGWTNRHDLDDGCRSWWCHDDRSWSNQHRRWNYHHGSWNRDSNADSHMNPSTCSGDSQSNQGKNCDILFHIHYRLDEAVGRSLSINRLPFCNVTFQ